MNDKQQLQEMGLHLSEQQAKCIADAFAEIDYALELPPTQEGGLCMAKQIEDLQTRLQECAKGAAKMQEQRNYAYKMMGKFGGERDELARQLKAANQQIAAMTVMLIELREGAELHLHNCAVCKNDLGISNWTNKLDRIDAMLAAAPRPEPKK